MNQPSKIVNSISSNYNFMNKPQEHMKLVNYTSLDSNIIKTFQPLCRGHHQLLHDLKVINKQVRPSRVVGMEMQ